MQSDLNISVGWDADVQMPYDETLCSDYKYCVFIVFTNAITSECKSITDRSGEQMEQHTYPAHHQVPNEIC